jgi:hypothetical protein
MRIIHNLTRDQFFAPGRNVIKVMTRAAKDIAAQT